VIPFTSFPLGIRNFQSMEPINVVDETNSSEATRNCVPLNEFLEILTQPEEVKYYPEGLAVPDQLVVKYGALMG
jgi:hypothetical protein